MKPLPLLALACTLFPAAISGAQANALSQPPAPAHCSVQPPPSDPTPGDIAFAHGDFHAARSLYMAQVSSSPAPSAYDRLTQTLLQLNMLSEAASTASAAAVAFPASGDALALKGEVLLRSGQIPEAAKAMSSALLADPCSPHAHLGVARLSRILARGSIATQELATAHHLAPADPEVTAAWAESLPAAQRSGTLRLLLASRPTLPPAEISRIQSSLAILDQQKSCTSVPFAHADLTMVPLMISGIYPRSWALKATINAADLPPLEIDTTVSGIVLNPHDAQKAGVQPLVPGSQSNDAPYDAYADRIRIGSVEYRDCPVHVVPAKELANLNSLIGLNFFRDHLLHLDYVTSTLTLSPLPAVPGPPPAPFSDRYIAEDEKTWSPVYQVDANLLVPTLVNKKGPYLFAIDTGSWRTVFDRSAGNAVSCLHDSTLLFRGVSGPIVKVLPMDGSQNDASNVRTLDGADLKIGAPDGVAELRWGGVDYISRVPLCFDIGAKSHATGIEVAGLIGFSDLSAFFIDLNYRDALIHLQFDPMRRYDARIQVHNP